MHSDGLKQPVSTRQDLFHNCSMDTNRFSVRCLHGKKKTLVHSLILVYFMPSLPCKVQLTGRNMSDENGGSDRE